MGAEILADGVRRQRGRKLGQHGARWR
jgi:hypothetical protein